jgi:hypothetical protein
MLYGSYRRDKEYLVGSGPIESANGNIIQKRIKLSGQRWTEQRMQKHGLPKSRYKSRIWSDPKITKGCIIEIMQYTHEKISHIKTIFMQSVLIGM